MINKLRYTCAVVAGVTLSVIASTAAFAQMPEVPAAIKDKGVLNVGVRCDQPPYGFQDGNGEFAGVEADMARQLAEWIFGSEDKAALTCVTAENRIPQLTGNRVDLLIATLGVTPERERVIDFSIPYRWGASGMLVKADSKYQKIADLKGSTVALPKGTVQAKWFEDNMPEVNTLRLNSAGDSLQALKQGRADGYAHDAATLVVAAAKDKTLRMVDDPYQLSDAAMGLRKNEPEWKAYLDAAVKRMHDEKLFRAWIDKAVPEEIRSYYYQVFETTRPDRS